MVCIGKRRGRSKSNRFKRTEKEIIDKSKPLDKKDKFEEEKDIDIRVVRVRRWHWCFDHVTRL